MRREPPVRIWEGLGVKLPRATRLIITGTSQVLLEHGVQPLVAQFLAARGLELSHEKTRITHSSDGFDFLGQNVRRFASGKVLLRPAAKNVRTFLAKIRKVLREEGQRATAGELIRLLNAQITGWALYHRHACSKRIFAKVDDRIYHMLWRWCRRRHRHEPRRQLYAHYFQRVGNQSGVFTGTLLDGKGRAYLIALHKARQIRIVRHVKVRGDANPYDPAWELYFEDRLFQKLQTTLAGRGRIAYLYQEQNGRCGSCGQFLQEAEDWHIHHRDWRSHGGSDDVTNLELLHAHCHRQKHSTGSGNENDCVARAALAKA